MTLTRIRYKRVKGFRCTRWDLNPHLVGDAKCWKSWRQLYYFMVWLSINSNSKKIWLHDVDRVWCPYSFPSITGKKSCSWTDNAINHFMNDGLFILKALSGWKRYSEFNLPDAFVVKSCHNFNKTKMKLSYL